MIRLKDSIFYIPALCKIYKYPRIVFTKPFTVDQRWDGKITLIDSFQVYNAPSVFTPTETFENSFNIYHFYYGPNSKYNDNYWFKPNVGMVAVYTNNENVAEKMRTYDGTDVRVYLPYNFPSAVNNLCWQRYVFE